ncbi:MAG TPA: M28 family peptidase [Anaeromyxobacter sp.]|nr:M28 family peptidase [Anaeromyxobacter sp.]
MLSGHHDHLGIDPAAPPGTDAIYNGALDSASGCATVLAMARAALSAPHRRSNLVLFSTGEGMGLLGWHGFARHPPVPAGRIAADLNLDTVNIWGRTLDLGDLSLGRSSLDVVVREVAAAQGRTVHGDPHPDRGSYSRGNNLELARVGVPDLSVSGGPHFRGRPPRWGDEQVTAWVSQHYHQPSDEYPPWPGRWDLSGAVEDAQLALVVALRVANAQGLPRWRKGDEFEAAQVSTPR